MESVIRDLSPMLLIAGRALLGSLFVIGGIRHFMALGPITEAVSARGVPFPRLSLIAVSVFEIIAGVLLMLGLFVAPAALGLACFTLAASFLMLNFWDLEGDARTAFINAWLTNLAVIGGLFVVAAQPTTQ